MGERDLESDGASPLADESSTTHTKTEADDGLDTAPSVLRTAADKDPFEVGWENGDKDPLNPRSMTPFRKWFIVGITSFGSFAVTCASSMYTATYTQMIPRFHTSREVATLGLSFFVLGIAFGPMWSPLSESYGRRPIYIASFTLFTIWNIPTAVARNIATVIVSRFLQGLSGSAFLSVSGGTVHDLFAPEEMQLPMTVFSMAPFVGPAIGPLVGGLINTWTSWRWTHYVLIIWSFCLLVAITLLVPETFHPICLRNKAKKVRKETGEERWRAPVEKVEKSIMKTMGLTLLRPFEILIFEPMALVLNLYSALLMGVLYLFFGAFPLVFENNHGFNLWQVGLTFLGLLVGNVVGGSTAPLWTNVRQRLIAKNAAETGTAGKSEPEYRLPPFMLGTIFVPIGLFWFGWSTYSSVHWIVPIIGSAIFSTGMLLSFTGVFTFLVDAYGRYAASALAANTFARCSFGAVFPLFGIQMYDKLGYQWATSLLAFLTVAMLPFPYIFFRYGKRIRAHSRMAVSE